MPQSNESRLLSLLQNQFGPQIWSLLQAPDLEELMVNPDGRIWADHFGREVELTPHTLAPAAVEGIIRLVASANDETCGPSNPSVGAVLPGIGARFHGVLPPVVPAPAFSIRRRATRVYTLGDYVRDGIMPQTFADAIRDAALQRKNLLIIGGTGSGKTTLANAILSVISQTQDRILTIEDTPELQVSAPNHIPLYVKDDLGYTWQQAVKDSLRLRPDRIIVGEVRDGSALDLLKAWNTGHNGGCATIHANSARRGLTRLESLIKEVSLSVPRELIADAIDLLVHIRRTRDGRAVDEICQVNGVNPSGQYAIQNINP